MTVQGERAVKGILFPKGGSLAPGKYGKGNAPAYSGNSSGRCPGVETGETPKFKVFPVNTNPIHRYHTVSHREVHKAPLYSDRKMH